MKATVGALLFAFGGIMACATQANSLDDQFERLTPPQQAIAWSARLNYYLIFERLTDHTGIEPGDPEFPIILASIRTCASTMLSGIQDGSLTSAAEAANDEANCVDVETEFEGLHLIVVADPVLIPPT